MPLWSYLFYPNPANAGYTSPKAVVLLIVSLAFIVAWQLLKRWRKNNANPVTKKLSKSWPTASLWFGISGLIMVISRAEEISFLSMRFLWLVWLVALIAYVFLQIKLFRARHYTPVKKERVEDPRDKYLPKKKR